MGISQTHSQSLGNKSDSFPISASQMLIEVLPLSSESAQYEWLCYLHVSLILYMSIYLHIIYGIYSYYIWYIFTCVQSIWVTHVNIYPHCTMYTCTHVNIYPQTRIKCKAPRKQFLYTVRVYIYMCMSEGIYLHVYIWVRVYIYMRMSEGIYLQVYRSCFLGALHLIRVSNTAISAVYTWKSVM